MYWQGDWLNELIDGPIKQSTSVATKFNNLLLLVSQQGHQNLKIKIVKLSASNSVIDRILIEVDWCLTNWKLMDWIRLVIDWLSDCFFLFHWETGKEIMVSRDWIGKFHTDRLTNKQSGEW